ncbi:uncharacterized protein PHACADRAFT_213512 [Phanerochaete carnosa HHB-10118-sp]|uniref:BTB domain-containing protein n=1 Tax=Phanerochaete carnosa (strain HHB-10118-sp) TaxID=650164 RepID=K5WK23_PHACS|nr:uncharacterized protein PHACADRAFT_213512 [Phanerochaete carnosa HHB-10118-sp]EKM50612.1 hypothetical protein PHACADRAFT_213512 [Phanerochaete carnosa HHB-10118-sp]
MAPPKSKPKPVQHAFNKPSADVILRSSDKVSFHVHKPVLSDASSFFETMFTLPGNASSSTSADGPSPPGPAISSAVRAADVLAIADKYAMDGVIQHVKNFLESSNFLELGVSSVMRVYAIARQHDFTNLAEQAACASLKHPLLSYTLTGLNNMTAAHYQDLIRYRQRCIELIDRKTDEDGNREWDDPINDIWNEEMYERFESNFPASGFPETVITGLDDCIECRGRLWFQLHYHRLKEAFSKRVCGASLNDPGILDQTVASIKECSDYMEHVPMELVEFNKRLGDILDLELEDISALDMKEFKHSFNRPTADVVLRSSDNVDFKAHKAILAEASTVFETMFTLPTNPSQDVDTSDGLPVIQMQECADAIHALLGVLYPGKGPEVTDVDRAGVVLALADKYAMDGVTKHVRSSLEDFLDYEFGLSALGVCALARRYGFVDLVESAARTWLENPFHSYQTSGLQVMTSVEYHDLLCFRQHCADLIDNYIPNDDEYCWGEFVQSVWDDEVLARFESNRSFADAAITKLGRCTGGKNHWFWFQLHVRRLKDAYTRRVCGKSLTDREILDKSIAGMDCMECLPQLPMEFMEFNQRLAAMLDKDIRKVMATIVETSIAQPVTELALSDTFNSATADLVLRSSDGIDFRVHRSLLAIASSVFEGMCSLPQPSTSDERQQLPLVPMEETSHTLYTLLLLLYPDKHPRT